ncbi:MAG: potassium channel protein [Candidatus Palauibacterales bacterium]|jgi:voltage-gated potassium channel|nr:potassium channel protein [Candidatus Palauibacterales bacterium]
MSSFWRRSALMALGGLALLLIGTVGFLLIPEYTLSDSIYMTVITLTAVGYQEVHPLQTGGRILAGFLLLGGITLMGVWFALLTSALVEMDLAHVFLTRRTMKKIETLKNHYIVCGAGRTGRQVARELQAAGKEYVVIEREGDRTEALRAEIPDVLVVEADATRDESLIDARIGTAAGLVTCLSADTDNLFVCLSARDLQPGLTIVARAYNEQTLQKLYVAGADHVVSPNLTGGMRMAAMLLQPEVVSFLDVATRSQELDLRLEEVRVPAGSPFESQTLAEVRIPSKTGLIVIAARHGDAPGREGEWVYNPGPDHRIEAGDVLIVMGREEQIDLLTRSVQV